ncbi:PspC domain-containing protein [Mycetocola spongiae]|uniref:PspC domain-containing protein n=1 Tax=Mycetocola spongiae TaxID=2859226 RepID=UPI001CF54EEB|nr:PspC domain-containing protein [Mycetocola spongiae]UCR90109.1 PspC domain-containing protein [Mycetocola spongiae]
MTENSSGGQGPAPQAPQNFLSWVRGLGIVRGEDRWVAGVAAGIATRTGLDPLLVRGILVVLTMFSGLGLVFYGLAWALLPARDGRIAVEEVGRGHWSGGMTGATITVLLGLMPRFFDWSGNRYGLGSLLWTMIGIGAIVLVIWMIIRSARGRSTTPPSSGAPYGYAPGYTPPGAPAPGFPPAAPAAGAPGGAGYPAAPFAPAAPEAPHASAPAGGETIPEPSPEADTEAPAEAATEAASAPGPGSEPAEHTAIIEPAPGDTTAYPTTALPHAFGSTAPTEAYPPSGFIGAAPSMPPGSVPPAGPGLPVSATAAPYAPPRKPRRRTASGGAIILILGAALLAGGTMVALDFTGVLDLGRNTVPAAIASALAILALGIIGLGLSGRRSGFLGFAATVAIIACLFTGMNGQQARWGVVSQPSFSETTVEGAQRGYSFIAADGTVDLSALRVSRRDIPVEVPVTSVMSDVTVIVPRSLTVKVESRVLLGRSLQENSLLAEGGRTPDLILTLSGTMSSITVTDKHED